MYSTDENLSDALLRAGEQSDDGLWKMPLVASYRENIKSPIADVANIGSKGGGSITAALFLQEFVSKTKWAHIGILDKNTKCCIFTLLIPTSLFSRQIWQVLHIFPSYECDLVFKKSYTSRASLGQCEEKSDRIWS
jgi:hypothetical protein